jgi:hypothetical protein
MTKKNLIKKNVLKTLSFLNKRKVISRTTSFNVVLVELNKTNEVMFWFNNLFLFRRFDNHGQDYQEK